jgi:hypothetical protein
MASSFINTIIFILFLPELFFTLPKNGNRKSIAAVHGILYSLVYMLLTISADSKNMKKCVESLAGSKGDQEGGEGGEGGEEGGEGGGDE